MTPKEYKQMMDYLTRSGIRKQIKFASDIARPDPKPVVKEIELFNEFNKRNPRADGGRIGFYKGESAVKSHGQKIKELTEAGESSVSIAKKLKLKQQTVNAAMDAMDKGIAGEEFKLSKPRKDIVKLSVNQYAPMRSLEEVQKAIDNAPPIEIDGKLFEQNPKDLRGDSEFSGKEVVTRKEQDKYGDKLKYKSTGKKRIVPVTQAYYDRRARELAKSNPTILKKLSGKGGYQLSHLSLSELDTLKNLGYLPAEINLKQYFPFEKKIVEISQEIYETQNNKKLSAQEKRDKIAELQKKDRALRKQFPQFAKTKARLNVRATGLDPSGLMIKEKLPDPSIAIAPTEAGTQLKGTAVGSEKGKAILEFGKNNLQKLAAIGCPGKMMGGRIGFFKGQNLNACAAKGLQKLQTTDVKKLTPGDKANVRAITKTVQGGRVLKNVLGPGALAFEGLFALPFAAYDYARGRPGIDTLKNVASLGFLDQKLTDAELKKIFPEYGQAENLQNIGDRLTNLERLQKGTRGQRIRSKPQFEKTMDQFETVSKPFLEAEDPEKAYFENIQKSQDAVKELQRQYDERALERKSQFDLSDPFMAAGGGIAKIAGVDSGPPPESGPNSQGLQGLMKRVKNL